VLSPYLLMNRDRGGNEVVGDGDLFVFREKDALVGLCPHVVEVLDAFLYSEIGGSASRVEMINWIFYHHFWREDFFVAARNFQEMVPIECLKKKSMPGIVRAL
jgi:hypothetical protein